MRWSERFDATTSAIALPAVLLVAFAVRAVHVTAGLPHAIGIDEPAIVERALRILNTGDWNPHVFDYPTLVIYVHALLAIAVFLGGAAAGAWASLEAFDVVAVYAASRLLTAAIGLATVLLTYRIADAIGGRAVGLLAAAQLAVLSMHVRESHFALTDVPVTALTTLAIWLSMRAAMTRTIGAYAGAGAACGLAAAAKYNGVVALVAPAAVWLAHDRAAPDRWKKAGAAGIAAAAAFLVAVPYSVFDLPAFLGGFAAQAGRFTEPRGGEPPWLVYLKHLALGRDDWLPVAAAGIVLVLSRRSTRTRALPLLAFAAAYFYTLATHTLVFARYALPILPAVCVLAAVAAIEGVRTLERLGRPRVARWALVGAVLALPGWFAVQSASWLRQFAAPDTREIAARWMSANLPTGARVVVENSGPAYLRTLGFEIVRVGFVDQRDLEDYRDLQVHYLVISSHDVQRFRDYLKAGPTVFEIAPSPSRWGPPVRIVQLAR
jgi:4-amino-4-deoxy-L-arabinose transferase-like glycosyltransferase